ncbi:bifunctional DNA primase/polymerase [Actinomadura verrucosospora]|uniref:Bifunctional DNA primase/polymerase n=1 Tax=Actinomadura verrucosospora TaxID=46165 RepID=A0A7D3W6G3_ACTVE|nr:bifunctional DNA primase/polymerase [Actinomadura verrucosospora]QKG27311.1 bifunctional DNA primase/polymerase [Actinomadura verrucosospora]
MTHSIPHPGAAALACARRGWHVFPLTPRDKTPLAGFTDWETNATTDPARVRAFWSRDRYNVGIACGPSGLVVIDLDTPKPGETPPTQWALPGVNEGADVLAVLCERHGQPFPTDTFTVTTRRGGTHLYFTAPPGAELRNTSGRYRTGLGWLIDTRAAGGYVVAPGSFVDLPDGTGPYTVTNPAPPAPLPGWLADLLAAARAAPTPLGAGNRPGTVADLPSYVQAALKGEAARVAGAVPGGRNHALNKAAYNLGRLIGAGLLPEDAARDVLWGAVSVHLGPDRTADIHPADARATIGCALAAGARKPRTITRGYAA